MPSNSQRPFLGPSGTSCCCKTIVKLKVIIMLKISKWWFLSRLRCFFTGGCSGFKGKCICICLVWISVGVEPMFSKMVGTSENCGTSKTDNMDKMDGLNRNQKTPTKGFDVDLYCTYSYMQCVIYIYIIHWLSAKGFTWDVFCVQLSWSVELLVSPTFGSLFRRFDVNSNHGLFFI